MTSANAIQLYGRATAGFESRVDNARLILAAAATAHRGAIVQASSLGA